MYYLSVHVEGLCFFYQVLAQIHDTEFYSMLFSYFLSCFEFLGVELDIGFGVPKRMSLMLVSGKDTHGS